MPEGQRKSAHQSVARELAAVMDGYKHAALNNATSHWGALYVSTRDSSDCDADRRSVHPDRLAYKILGVQMHRRPPEGHSSSQARLVGPASSEPTSLLPA